MATENASKSAQPYAAFGPPDHGYKVLLKSIEQRFLMDKEFPTLSST